MTGDLAIRFVTRKWAPAIGGMETYCVQIADALRAHCPVETIALPGRVDGRPPSTAKLLGWGMSTALRLLLAKPAPVVFIGDMALWPLGWLARLRGPGSRILLTAHGTDVSFSRRGGLLGGLYGTYLRCGARLLAKARVVAVSHATRKAAEDSGWNVSAVVPLATHLHGDRPPEGHDGSILFVGRLIELKGCRWFVRNVLPILPKGTKLRIAGPLTDPSESAVLAAEGVEYLGTLRGEDLVAAYRRALCVILPNIEPANGQFEGFGIVAVEASAAGGLVLAADCGGLREAVIAGETGMLVPSGDSQAWAEAIAKVAAWTPQARRGFLEKSMRKSAAHYNWDQVARETLAICAKAG